MQRALVTAFHRISIRLGLHLSLRHGLRISVHLGLRFVGLGVSLTSMGEKALEGFLYL
jgi:hypothetical protein